MAAEKKIDAEVRSNLESYEHREERREGSLARSWVIDEHEQGVKAAVWPCCVLRWRSVL